MILAWIVKPETCAFCDNHCSCHEIPGQICICLSRKCQTFGSGCSCCVHEAIMSRNSVVFLIEQVCGVHRGRSDINMSCQQTNTLTCTLSIAVRNGDEQHIDPALQT